MQIPGPTPFVAHWPSSEHITHVFVVRSQIGFVGSTLQSALVALAHSTQSPLGPQTGLVPSREAQAAPSPKRVVSQARHDPVSQIGRPDGHSLLVVHSEATSEVLPSGRPPSEGAQV
jgi:hypothetical protein